jgi:prolyl 4-hydroxylase
MQSKNKMVGKQEFVVQPHVLKQDLLDVAYQPKLKRKRIKNHPIYTIPKLLNEAECNRLIALGQTYGFQQAGLAIGQDLYRIKERTRNNKRFMFEHSALAEGLGARLNHLVDQKYNNHQFVGLNWRFRLYEYPEGGLFAPHVDERMELDGAQGGTTLFTFMIYLNEPKSGGETTFFEPRRKGQKQLQVYKSIRPKTGMGLAFDHLLFHEGSVVKQGVKYALRTDLIYKK